MMHRSVAKAGRKAVRGMATGKDVRFGAEVCSSHPHAPGDVTCGKRC